MKDPEGGNRSAPPLLEVRGVSKTFGGVTALEDVSLGVRAAEVTCLLGDNGAGKSTLVGILAGAHAPTVGEYRVDGAPVRFASPRDARARGIATVYQSLAVVPLMSVWRNFFLGSEPTVGAGPLRRIDVKRCREIAGEELARMGIGLRDPDQPVGTLSGGERQSVAIARALYFGARVLLLDEPTAALGVRQSGVVLAQIRQARDRGAAVVFITHNPHHAYPVGNRFAILRQGRLVGQFVRGELEPDELARLMGGEREPDPPGSYD